jgi:hypothetical protein
MQTTRISRVYEFSLGELISVGGIDGMNDSVQARYESEEGESAGILGDLAYYAHHINEEHGLIGIQVFAEVMPID